VCAGSQVLQSCKHLEDEKAFFIAQIDVLAVERIREMQRMRDRNIT
jgi:hypothetical protein